MKYDMFPKCFIADRTGVRPDAAVALQAGCAWEWDFAEAAVSEILTSFV